MIKTTNLLALIKQIQEVILAYLDNSIYIESITIV